MENSHGHLGTYSREIASIGSGGHEIESSRSCVGEIALRIGPSLKASPPNLPSHRLTTRVIPTRTDVSTVELAFLSSVPPT